MEQKHASALQALTNNRTLSIREWPKSERPRERLLEQGAEALSNAELLAILIGHGQKGMSAVEVARRLLQDTKLQDLSSTQLIKARGVGPAKAAKILAGIELGRRLMIEGRTETSRLTTSAAVHEYLKPKFYGKTVELFLLIAVDIKNRPLGVVEISKGTSEGVTFQPKDVFLEAIKLGASGVICAHNHPSGDPTPSSEDTQLTSRLREGAVLLGVRFLDHIVVAGERYYSFADQGALTPSLAPRK